MPRKLVICDSDDDIGVVSSDEERAASRRIVPAKISRSSEVSESRKSANMARRPRRKVVEGGARGKTKRRKIESDEEGSDSDSDASAIASPRRQVTNSRARVFDDDDSDSPDMAEDPVFTGLSASPASRKSLRERNRNKHHISEALKKLDAKRRGTLPGVTTEADEESDSGEMDQDLGIDDEAADESSWIVGDDAPTDSKHYVECICGARESNSLYTGLWVRCTNKLCASGSWGHAICYGYQQGDRPPKKFLCHHCSVSLQKPAITRSQHQSTFEKLLSAAQTGDAKNLRAVLRKAPASAATWMSTEHAHRAWTPLHFSISLGHVECVSLLLDHNADMLWVDLDGVSPLALAVSSDQSDCLKTLLKRAPDLPLTTIHGLLSLAARLLASRCLCLLLDSFTDVNVNHVDAEGMTLVLDAATAGSTHCFLELIDRGANLLQQSAQGANALHLAAGSGASNMARTAALQLPPSALSSVDTDLGWPPLLWAVQSGDTDTVKEILDADGAPRIGRDTFFRDEEGTTAMHVAALGGHSEIVRLLYERGHPIDCEDHAGWPPLLYADYNAKRECVLNLMRPKPEQMAVLGRLLSNPAPTLSQTERNRKSVINLLSALATTEEFYTVLNDFIGAHPELLDDSLEFLWKCKGLIDFRNKSKWFHRKMDVFRNEAMGMGALAPYFVTYRENALLSMHHGLNQVTSEALRCGVDSSIFGEPGTALGPTREVLTLIARDLTRSDLFMFEPAPDDPSMCVPCAVHSADGSTGGPVPGNHDRKSVFWSVGRLMGACLTSRLNFACQLAPATLQELMGIPIQSYSSLMREHDLNFATSMEFVLDNDPADLDLTFSIDVPIVGMALAAHSASGLDDDNTATGSESLGSPVDNVVGSRTVNVPLSKHVPPDRPVTMQNAAEYVELLAAYKLKTSVCTEIEALRRGLTDVIPEDLLSRFTFAEFALLLNGVTVLSVLDWRKNTTLVGFSESSPQIQWFWQLVTDLTNEEKSLLLQFWTGCTATPAGGFAELEGLNHQSSGCTLARTTATTSGLPTSSTCFNLLKLPEYATPYDLRRMVLIAIRHGSDGFSFA